MSRIEETPSTLRSSYGYVVVAAGTLSMALIFSVHYAFGVFFKPLSTEFHWTRAETAGAFSLVWIMQGILSVVMGGLTDRYGPRLVLSISGLLVGCGYLLTSQAHSLLQLYLFYGVLVGAGLGGTFVPLTSATARWFKHRRGVMIGIVTSGVGVGALIGPPIANWIITNYNWRTSYAVMGAVVLVGVVAAAQFMRKAPAGLHADAPSHQGGLTLAQSLATWQLWIVSLAFVCYGYTWTAILLHLGPHATDTGFSAATAARLIAAIGAGSILGKVLLGIVADRIGDKRVYLLSFAMMAVSLLWLTVSSRPSSFFLFATAFGFAYGGLATAHSPLIAWLFGMRAHGLIFGVCFNGFTIGCAAGPIVAGHIFDRTHSYSLAFLVCAGLCLLGFLLILTLRPATHVTAPRATTELLEEAI